MPDIPAPPIPTMWVRLRSICSGCVVMGSSIFVGRAVALKWGVVVVSPGRGHLLVPGLGVRLTLVREPSQRL